MSVDDVSLLARATAAKAGVSFNAMAPHVYQTEGRFAWRVDSATIGNGWRVEVDDATVRSGRSPDGPLDVTLGTTCGEGRVLLSSSP